MRKFKAFFISMIILGSTSTALLAVTNTSTNSQKAAHTATAEKNQAATEDKHEEHLDYHKQEDWSFVSGKMQSPINIETQNTKSAASTMSGIELDLSKKINSIEDNGHSIQVEGSGKVKLDNREFEFNQVHFHSKSEHTIDGKNYPIEAHFVNKSQNGRLAVIGVMFSEGKENETFKSILGQIKKGEKVTTVKDMDLLKMLPDNKSYYHYLGSLTTPPLTENVEWYVLKNTVEVSKKQIEAFNKYYNFNNRAIQNLEGREVIEYNN